LSTSLNYFSSITPQELSASFVHNAVVTVSNGAANVTLKEYSITDSTGFNSYFYSVDTVNPASILLGALNSQYQLDIQTSDGKSYSSSVTIPALTELCDSLWWEPAQDGNYTNLCLMYGKFTDPPGPERYTRYFTKDNSGPFLPGLNSVFNDQFTNGTTYTFQFDMGWDKNSLQKPSGTHYGFAFPGDTVTLKYCNIDLATYTFWSTWEFAYQSYGNPFSSPITVIGNISNGALGDFSGYAAQYKTIVIPR
jgi:hypothetical protein